MFFAKKLSEAELAEHPLDKKGLKEGRSLLKGVRKFLRYNEDLIDDEEKRRIAELEGAFTEALVDPAAKRKELEVLAKDLTETCRKSVKDYKVSAWKENIEVVFVAVVIAMGIRAYFIQQFKIPTGSMQPTLNGIIAYPTREMNPRSDYHAPDDYSKPGVVKSLVDKVWYGRSHIEWVSREDDAIILDGTYFYEKTHFLFFPRTYLKTRNGQVYSAPGTESRVLSLINRQLVHNPEYVRTFPVKKGQTIAKGFVDTGDQLVVNKAIYHWKRPQRGDVFVFNTRDIDGIQRTIDPRHGSQHYIKRLVGLPEDEVVIDPPRLLIDGRDAEEPGIRRVVSQEGRYTGYTAMGATSTKLAPRAYWALGDNSENSSDSRNWGPVPEKNIVGRAAFVYFPFGHHFGRVN